MSEVAIQVNPNAALEVIRVGREQTPVILIDDFALETGELIDYACRANDYGPDSTSAYPGVRARLPRQYVITVLNQIYRLLFQVYSVPADLGMKPVNTVYSLISTAAQDLKPGQRVPHFDSVRPYYLAVLHYLNPGPFCDTGLFRHRPTGFERILAHREAEYRRSSAAYMRHNGEPAAGYICDSNDHYELYERIGYRPNRLVAYPGTLLHSGLVDPDRDINPDPRTGRLTANIFVDFH